MPRVSSTPQVRPDRPAEDRECHAAVRPGMLRDGGRHDHQLFLREFGPPVGVVGTDDLAAAPAAVDAHEVSARWEAEMAPSSGTGDGRGTSTLDLVLDAQHAALRSPEPAPTTAQTGERP